MTPPHDDLLTLTVDPDAEPAGDVLDVLADLLIDMSTNPSGKGIDSHHDVTPPPPSTTSTENR